MDKLKKFFGKNHEGREGAREDFDALLKRAAKPTPDTHVKRTEVDTQKFATAVVQEYGETLVLLGKE